MARDIEEFLRKAAERRRQQAQQQGAAPPPDPAPPPAQRASQPPAQRSSPPPAQRASQPPAQRASQPPAAPRRTDSGQFPNASEPAKRRMQAETGDDEVVRPGESVSAHVDRHIKSKPLSERAKQRVGEGARQLGAEVGQADERLEQRLHEKFDHSVGTLGSRVADEQDEMIPASGLELLKLLTSPRSMRQAILLAEILKRPDY